MRKIPQLLSRLNFNTPSIYLWRILKISFPLLVFSLGIALVGVIEVARII